MFSTHKLNFLERELYPALFVAEQSFRPLLTPSLRQWRSERGTESSGDGDERVATGTTERHQTSSTTQRNACR